MLNRNNIYRKIYALLKDTGHDNDWLHEFLPEWFAGKKSLKELERGELDKLIKILEKMSSIRTLAKGMMMNIATGGVPQRPFIQEKTFPGMRTNKQAQKIWQLKRAHNMTDESLNKFIERTTSDKSSVDGLTVREASAVITGLSKLVIKK